MNADKFQEQMQLVYESLETAAANYSMQQLLLATVRLAKVVAMLNDELEKGKCEPLSEPKVEAKNES